MNARALCPVIPDNFKRCQRLLDVKAFKGKGQAWELLLTVRASIEDCWAEMLRLSLESGHMQTPAYLQVHRYPGLARIPAVSFLRWRLRQAGRDLHAGWEQVDGMVADQPIAVRRYYWALNQRMLDLNCLAQVLQQTAIRLLLRLSDRNARQTSGDGDVPGGVQLFLAWVKGDITLADFDMRQEPFHSADDAGRAQT